MCSVNDGWELIEAPLHAEMYKTMYVNNDGGRASAGFKGSVGDCAVRAIAIATGAPYQQVYDDMSKLCREARVTKRRKAKASARDGVYRSVFDKYMSQLGGWAWVSTMGIGTGCKVHLKADELPSGKLICRVSKHYVAVIDGVINDTHNPSRGGTRCVYGYWKDFAA